MINEALLKTLTVLYVEDNDLVKRMLTKFLRRRVGNIYDKSNGKEGLDVYVKHQDEIDVVITGIEMPIMSGKEMIERIFEIDQFQPIIITTACRDEEHTSDKVCKNVIKPINEDDLLESIIYCVEKRVSQEISSNVSLAEHV
ncbi:response regulator receiver protein [Candidatus Magnetobacterium bavaricum]|uniref:Response regulator receiver protein n=1 Tax=Candidatus Magnetobacterium bavaricum TaxID=29290 RepID=A0A0F3GX80_9BACT|nr:response regulator receiver protein [Candidatus Magnetobacterium bavaricum]